MIVRAVTGVEVAAIFQSDQHAPTTAPAHRNAASAGAGIEKSMILLAAPPADRPGF
jgi:hypothetical protein